MIQTAPSSDDTVLYPVRPQSDQNLLHKLVPPHCQSDCLLQG